MCRPRVRLDFIFSALLLGLAVAGSALASTTGPDMPWDRPIETILNNLSGTVAHLLVTIAIVLTGILFAFGEHGTAMRRLLGIAFGASLALGAVTVLTSLGFIGAVI